MAPATEIWLDFEPSVSSDLIKVRCWLPMQLFQRVDVAVERRQEMTLLERFAVEALLTLGCATTEDFREVASIPPELGGWLLASLVQKQLAVRREGEYCPVRDRCEEALERSSLPVSRTERRDCLWFPESNELVVLRHSAPLRVGLSRLRPTAQCPLPADLASRPRTDILRRAANDGTVYEPSRAVIKDMTAAGQAGDTCPAYTAQIVLSLSGGKEGLRVTLLGHERAKGETGDTGAMVELPLEIGFLKGVGVQCRQKYREALDAVREWCDGRKGVTADGEGASGPVIRASAEFLTEGGAGQLTGRNARVGVLQREYECEAPVVIEPADPDAARVMEIDSMIRRLLAGEEVGMDQPLRHEALSRAWDLGRFKPLYELRAAGDFAV